MIIQSELSCGALSAVPTFAMKFVFATELSSKYSNWEGLEARTKISILESDWRYIDKDEKARFWAAIKVYDTLYFSGMSSYIILHIFHHLIALF